VGITQDADHALSVASSRHQFRRRPARSGNGAARATALSVAAAAQWLANWAVSVSFPSLKNAGLGFAYGLYTAAALLSFVFVLKWVKETKGRELESM
jgi:SP family sugar:H+ symporter-like MFS transporter